MVRAFDDFVEDLSNWYIRRSRRRFWDGDEAALRTLWYALVTGLRVVAPVLPFLAEHLWQELLVAGARTHPIRCSSPAGRASAPPDEALLARGGARCGRVVALGHQARQSVALKVRQPLRAARRRGRAAGRRRTPDEIADELRVKAVEFGDVDATELRVKPNLPRARAEAREGARRGACGSRGRRVRGARMAGGFRVLGHELGPDDVIVERTGKEGWAVASLDGVTVALDTALDEELLREGRVNELVHQVNTMRKDAGLELTDRIVLTIPAADADLLEHEEWIKAETLAVEIRLGAELAIEKA